MRNIDIGMILLLLVAVASVPALTFAGTSGPAPIPNPPAFQVSTNTVTLCKGVVNTVPLVVTNLGKMNGSITMSSLQLGLSSSRSLVLVANGSANLITLPPNTTIVVKMPVFVNLNASSIISAGITVNYNYLNYYSDSEVRNVSFGTDACPSQLSVSVNPKTLTSGKIENISFTLANEGRTPLSDISLKASPPIIDGEILSIQPVSVGTLLPSASTKVNESVFVFSNASQTFPINVSISMYNGTQLEQLNPSIAVLSSGLINMSATSLSTSPSAPAPGEIFSISFVLTDLGTSGASAVYATENPPAGFTSFGSNSVFIGTMQTDSQTPVTLTLSSSSSLKAGSYTVPVKVTYLNNLRQGLNTTIMVPVTIAGTYNALANSGTGVAVRRSSGGGGLIILILLVAVIVLAYLFYKERKHRKKAAQEKR